MATVSFDFKGEVVIVTGSLGLEIAQAFGSAGAHSGSTQPNNS